MIALGIAISSQCEGCMISHIQTLISLGTTLEEIAEVVGVAILMGGGPSKNYGGKALAIANELLRHKS